MQAAFNGIFTLFQDFISFLMGCTVVTGVSLFSLFVVGFVFTLLLKFVVAVPHTYNGQKDSSHTYFYPTVEDGKVTYISHTVTRRGTWK